jgi:hypothetical protein
MFSHGSIASSDVLALLGLKAMALAWLLKTQAFKTCRLGQSHQWRLALTQELHPMGVKC